jgi:hypothetical protein
VTFPHMHTAYPGLLHFDYILFECVLYGDSFFGDIAALSGGTQEPSLATQALYHLSHTSTLM